MDHEGWLNSWRWASCDVAPLLIVFCLPFSAITYKVVIKTGKQLGGSTTTAQSWMTLAGSITDTGVMNLPKNENEFRFQVNENYIMSTTCWRLWVGKFENPLFCWLFNPCKPLRDHGTTVSSFHCLRNTTFLFRTPREPCQTDQTEVANISLGPQESNFTEILNSVVNCF